MRRLWDTGLISTQVNRFLSFLLNVMFLFDNISGFVSDEMTKLKEAGEADEGKAVVDASEIVEVREDANEDQVKLVQMSFGFWNPGK